MANTEYKIMLALGLGLAAICMLPIHTTAATTTAWNESVHTTVLNRLELGGVSAALPAWKMRQMVWPSSEELRSAGVAVDEKLKDASVAWLAKFLDPVQLPQDTKQHLVAMKNWGLVRAESEQRRLCDVFIVRFERGPHSVHIQESPANVVLTVGHEDRPVAADLDHRALVFQTAGIFLRQELRPNPQSKLLHLSRDNQGDATITKVTWQIESVMVTDEKGNTYRNGVKADQLGTWHVAAETDGRYVRFDIQKFVNAPTRLDPYAERF